MEGSVWLNNSEVPIKYLHSKEKLEGSIDFFHDYIRIFYTINLLFNY